MDWGLIILTVALYICVGAIMYLMLSQLDNNPIIVLFVTLFWPLGMVYMVLYFGIFAPIRDCVKYIKERKDE